MATGDRGLLSRRSCHEGGSPEGEAGLASAQFRLGLPKMPCAEARGDPLGICSSTRLSRHKPSYGINRIQQDRKEVMPCVTCFGFNRVTGIFHCETKLLGL